MRTYIKKGTASECKMGERNPNWKGGKYPKRDFRYVSLHRYMKKIIPKPEFCPRCNKASPYDLSNISGDYTRDPKGWEWICRRCHLLSDGRMNNIGGHRWQK